MRYSGVDAKSYSGKFSKVVHFQYGLHVNPFHGFSCVGISDSWKHLNNKMLNSGGVAGKTHTPKKKKKRIGTL